MELILQSFKTGNSTLYLADSLDVMRTIESKSIDSIVTDPPYGLKFMGKGWDHGIPGVPYWFEALRLAKPGAFLLAFGGTRTYHRLACAIEDAGWELRDSIGLPHESGEWGDCPWVMAWTYGSGFPKSLDVSKAIDKAAGVGRKVVGCSSGPNNSHYEGDRYIKKRVTRFGTVQDQPEATIPATEFARQWSGWGTALKPAWEPIIVARKPIEGTVVENVLKYGTGGINVDGCRVGYPEGDDALEKGLNRAKQLRADFRGGNFHTGDWSEKKRIVQSGMTSQGRFPANLIHDGSEEVLGLFPKTDSTRANGNPNNPIHQIIPDQLMSWGGIRETNDYRDRGSAARFFYCAKASKSEREAGCEDLEKRFVRRDSGQPFGMNTNQYRPDGSERKPIPPRHNNHPTVKPIALMRYLCRLVTPPGGVILDHFMGSGSTGVAAELEGFRFIGIDKEREAFDVACRRIEGNHGKR